MFLFNNLFNILFGPVDNVVSGGGPVETLDLLNEPITESEKEEVIDLKPEPKPEKDISKNDKKDKKNKDEEVDNDDEEVIEDEEVDELKEIEEELEDPDPEKLELVVPARKRDILKKYPQLFKDFPYLEAAYYREQQFTELLPSIDDARRAVDAQKVLNHFENELLSGNTETILKATKEQDPNAFNKLVDNYLPNLLKVDQNAYHHVVGNVIKDAVVALVRESKSTGDESFKEVAAKLYKFVFNTTEYSPPTKLAKEDSNQNPETNRLQEREQKFNQRRFEMARDDLSTRVDNVLKSTIQSNIDPKESMTDYVRKNAIREATEDLEKLISKDARFRTLLDKLWERAYKEDFDKQSTDRIRSAYLSKAKTLLPSVIKKARNEALKGLGKRVKEEEIEVEEEEKTPDPPRSHARSGNNNSDRNRSKDGSGMSTLEFFLEK